MYGGSSLGGSMTNFNNPQNNLNKGNNNLNNNSGNKKTHIKYIQLII